MITLLLLHKKKIIILFAVILLSVGVIMFKNIPPSGMPEGFSGIYIGESTICYEHECKFLKEVLPRNLLFVPIKSKTPLCAEIKEGWCKRGDTATSTLKGYFDDGLLVRTLNQ